MHSQVRGRWGGRSFITPAMDSNHFHETMKKRQQFFKKNIQTSLLLKIDKKYNENNPC